MKVVNYLFTGKDVKNYFKRLNRNKVIAVAGVALLYIALQSGGTASDSILLVVGLLAMVVGVSARTVLGMAALAVLVLFGLVPFIPATGSNDRLAERLAVLVFYLLILAVFKMVLDQLALATRARKLGKRLGFGPTMGVKQLPATPPAGSVLGNDLKYSTEETKKPKAPAPNARKPKKTILKGVGHAADAGIVTGKPAMQRLNAKRPANNKPHIRGTSPHSPRATVHRPRNIDGVHRTRRRPKTPLKKPVVTTPVRSKHRVKTNNHKIQG